MKEVWYKTNTVQQLKQNLQEKLSMLVNEDKLDQALNITKNQLKNLQEDRSPTSATLNLSSSNVAAAATQQDRDSVAVRNQARIFDRCNRNRSF